jgi:hypothetical protein
MGIDARILIKITKPELHLDAAALRHYSSQLTSTIGAERFFLQPDKNRHALSFCIDTFKEYPEEYEEATGKIWTPTSPAIFGQDSSEKPYIIAKPNEQFIECHVWSRYYGEEYARGDWSSLSMVLMWIVYNIPGAQVWYGGDSGGVELEKMTAKKLMEITKFYLTSGFESYRSYFFRETYVCEFCRRKMGDTGGGGDHTFWSCDGCDGQWVTRKTGYGADAKIEVTKYDPYGEDRNMKGNMVSFALSDQIKAGTRKLYPFDGIFRAQYPYVPKVEIVDESLLIEPALAQKLINGA